jgi:hypothetical protein
LVSSKINLIKIKIVIHMAFYTKADMIYNDYVWKAKLEHDNPNITGFPDNALLDRNEGYEVLYFINAVAKQSNWTANDKIGGNKIEKMLRVLPGSIRGRKNIYAWIVQNWNKD